MDLYGGHMWVHGSVPALHSFTLQRMLGGVTKVVVVGVGARPTRTPLWGQALPRVLRQSPTQAWTDVAVLMYYLAARPCEWTPMGPAHVTRVIPAGNVTWRACSALVTFGVRKTSRGTGSTTLPVWRCRECPALCPLEALKRIQERTQSLQGRAGQGTSWAAKVGRPSRWPCRTTGSP